MIFFDQVKWWWVWAGLEDSYDDNDEVTHDEEDVGNGADDKDDLHHAQYDQSHWTDTVFSQLSDKKYDLINFYRDRN